MLEPLEDNIEVRTPLRLPHVAFEDQHGAVCVWTARRDHRVRVINGVGLTRVPKEARLHAAV